MLFETEGLNFLPEALEQMEEAFEGLPAFETEVDLQRSQAVLQEAATRMWDNFPYPHPLYAGQMLKPPHPIARLAYCMAMYINPNNHALDGGRASSSMEKEAVAGIAEMFGWKSHLGHLTSGGTMANLEALWIASQIHPGKKVLASTQSHYTHSRISGVLKLEFESVPVNERAQMDINALASRLARGDVGTVVATVGTTGCGAVDPVPAVLELRDCYGFHLHVDAAYGGYFTLTDALDPSAREAFDHLAQVDSIVVDPHKHGLQPYGCGCILFRDPSVGRFYKHDSPYTYFSSDELHLGEISLECSRAGAAAVALWATMRLLPLERGGEFASLIAKGCAAAHEFYRRLAADRRFVTLMPPELDIVIWAPAASTASAISAASKAQFDAAAKANLHLALITLPQALLRPHWPEVQFDCDEVTCLRSCLMKPEHLDWLDEIWAILDTVAG